MEKKITIKNMLNLIPLVMILLVIVILRGSDSFEIIVKYSKPYCSECYIEFTSDTCSDCAKTILESGKIFENHKITKGVEFTKYWNDYETYKNEFDMCFILSLICIFCVAYYIFSFIIYSIEFKSRRELR